jgi:hypothetical protein
VKALAAVRREVPLPLPSRSASINFKPAGYKTSDLTDFSLCNLRICDWRTDHNISYNEQVKVVLSIDAVCFPPVYEYTENGKSSSSSGRLKKGGKSKPMALKNREKRKIQNSRFWIAWKFGSLRRRNPQSTKVDSQKASE